MSELSKSIFRIIQDQASGRISLSVTCPRCQGSGELEAAYSDEVYPCHECKGTGEMLIPHRSNRLVTFEKYQLN